jgi:hypothetical protein
MVKVARFRSTDTVINIRMVVTFSHHPRRLEGIAATSRQRSRGVQSKRLAEPTGTESSSAPQLTFLPLSSLQKNPVPSHGNKCQLDAFAEGPTAIHHIDFLTTAFPAPASVLVHLSIRALPMAPCRRERYLRPRGSTRTC